MFEVEITHYDGKVTKTRTIEEAVQMAKTDDSVRRISWTNGLTQEDIILTRIDQTKSTVVWKMAPITIIET